MRRISHFALLLLPALLARPAKAQEAVIRTIPDTTQESDVDEVDEVPLDSPNTGRIEREELSYSDDEMRSRHDYALGLAIGHAAPWQGYTVTAVYLVRPDVAAGLYGGGGGFHPSGISDQKSYDISMQSRGAGITGRYWFKRLEKLSLAGYFGYASWNGQISPHGSDDTAPDATDKLSAAFRATGLVAGTSCAITWMWDSGLYLQWTPVGVQGARILQKDFTRDSEIVRSAVVSNIERSGFYGLIDLEFGYLF